MQLQKDKNGYKLQIFTPTVGTTLVSPYTPTKDEVVMVGADVTITIDGVAILYTAGSVVGLRGGASYTLSVSVAVHKM